MIQHRRPFTANPARPFMILAGLAAFCLVQPVLDLVGKNPVFLVIQGLSAAEIILLPTLLIGGLAAILWLPIAVLSSRRPAVADAWLAIACSALLAVGLRPLLGRLVDWPGLVQIAVVAVTGTALVVAAARSRTVVRHAAALGWAAPLVVAAFLLTPGIRGVLAPSLAATVTRDAAPPDPTTPVVLIVFDAFATAAIMAADGGIDPVHCPNLAALADDAVWYRDALGVSDDTTLAVPAILTGRTPDPALKPVHTDHPANLLTWLQQHRPVHAFEGHTHLAAFNRPPGLLVRWRLLLNDLAVLAGHVWLPTDLAAGLPAVDHDWKGFTAGEDGIDPRDRNQLLHRFLDSLATEDAHSCWFIHLLLPHTPYAYMPSGRRYVRGPLEPGGEGLQWRAWSDDLQPVLQSQQRYLLQVGYTDRVVGRVTETLRERGLYEQAMIVVTADHGVAFEPDESRRELNTTNAGEVLAVPLLIKWPGLGAGYTDTSLARSVDILPTIAGALGTRPPWPVAGRDLRADPTPATTTVTIPGRRHDLTLDVSTVRRQRDDAVARKLERFGEAPGLPGLFAPRRGAALLGTRPLLHEMAHDLAAGLDRGPSLQVPADPAARLPAEITGYALAPNGWPDDWDIAITVDGTIAAITHPRRRDAADGVARWATLLPESVLVPGQRRLGLLLVHWRDGAPLIMAGGGADLGIVGTNLLVDQVPGSTLAGFAPPAGDHDAARWTDGHAVVRIATLGSTRVTGAIVGVPRAAASHGDLLVTANRRPVALLPLDRLPWRGQIGLNGIPLDGGLRLEFFSPSVERADLAVDGAAAPRLGVALGEVVLMDKPDPSLPTVARPQAITLDVADPAGWALSGFFDAEPWGESRAAWTLGTWQATLPLTTPTRPRLLLLEVASSGPHGATIRVDLGGQPVYAGSLPAGSRTVCIPLEAMSPLTAIDLAVNSSTFVPADLDPRSPDRRKLGLAMRGVRFVY